MTDKELEKMLEEQFDMLPPDDYLVKDITPWKRSMKYIFTGLFLMVVNIVIFIDISWLANICGYIFILLGFRNIRNENVYFKVGYIGAIMLNIRKLIYILLEMSIWKESIWLPSWNARFIISCALHMLIYVCVWLGIRKIESKVGKDKHSMHAALLPIYYGIMIIMAMMQTTGFIVIIFIALYINLLVELYRIYKSLEDSGYVIKASAIKFPNWAIVVSMIAICVIGVFVVSSFNKLPMKWERYEVTQTAEIDAIKHELIEQGIPEYVLNDLTVEDIKQCDGALAVVVDGIDVVAGDVDMSENPLKVYTYAICLDKEISRWKFVHYLVWESEPDFDGIEAISYNCYQFMNAENVSGYVMYDEEDVTYRAPYYSVDYEEYAVPFVGISSKDLVTRFSFDREGDNYRGYLTYELVSEISVNVMVDYYHQDSKIIYPANIVWNLADIKENVKEHSKIWAPFIHIRNFVGFQPWDEAYGLNIDNPLDEE